MITQFAVYIAYIPGIYCLLGLYNPHHLLPEPEKSIDHMYISGPPPSQQTYVSYKNSGIYSVSRTFGPLDFVVAPACSGIVPEPFCNGKN